MLDVASDLCRSVSIVSQRGWVEYRLSCSFQLKPGKKILIACLFIFQNPPGMQTTFAANAAEFFGGAFQRKKPESGESRDET